MTRIVCRIVRGMLVLLPLAPAGGQPPITVDPAVERRVLADTALVHALPAQRGQLRSWAAMDVTRGERAAMSPQLVGLSTLLREAPAVRRGTGAALEFRNELGVDVRQQGRLLTGRASMTAWPYMVLEGRLEYASAAVVDLLVNPDLCPAGEKVYGAGFRLAPRFDGRFHGFPMLDSVVVITRRTAPPCLPVSRARVVIALRRALDGLLAQLPGPGEFRERADALDALLARMSAGERASDAYLSGHGCAEVVCFGAPDEADAQQLVIPNPDFYDRTQPASVQVLALPLAPPIAPGNPPDEFRVRFMRDVLDSLDWAALSAMVH